jgi:hypothetical protein
MYKTIWAVKDESERETFRTELTLYHFGKTPKFPSWYMEENHVYEIEMLWNFKLEMRFHLFIKCLTHCYAIKDFHG